MSWNIYYFSSIKLFENILWKSLPLTLPVSHLSQILIIIWEREHAFSRLRLSFFNRNAVSSVLSVSSKFHARIHTLLQTIEHRDVARLKSPTATGKIMNELNLRKGSPCARVTRVIYLFFTPSVLDLLYPNGWYKFSYKWLLSGDVTAISP